MLSWNFLGFDDRDVLMTKRWYVDTTAATLSTAFTINATSSNTNNTTVTAVTTMLESEIFKQF